MEIFNKGAWKPLCNANWDDKERNLVCQVHGYNGSSWKNDRQSETNRSENTPHSCEQLAQNCKDKIDREINCSGIVTFFCPQNGSRVRIRIDTSIVMAVLTLSLKSLHWADFQQPQASQFNIHSMKPICESLQNISLANKTLSNVIQLSVSAISLLVLLIVIRKPLAA